MRRGARGFGLWGVLIAVVLLFLTAAFAAKSDNIPVTAIPTQQ